MRSGCSTRPFRKRKRLTCCSRGWRKPGSIPRRPEAQFGPLPICGRGYLYPVTLGAVRHFGRGTVVAPRHFLVPLAFGVLIFDGRGFSRSLLFGGNALSGVHGFSVCCKRLREDSL